MQNVKVKVAGEKMTIEIDLSKDLGPSGSGKSIVIGSTKGNKEVPGHPGMFMGVNVYKKND